MKRQNKTRSRVCMIEYLATWQAINLKLRIEAQTSSISDQISGFQTSTSLRAEMVLLIAQIKLTSNTSLARWRMPKTLFRNSLRTYSSPKKNRRFHLQFQLLSGLNFKDRSHCLSARGLSPTWKAKKQILNWVPKIIQTKLTVFIN